MLQRIQRRAGRILRELVPHNLHYRPVGVHAESQPLAARAGSGAAYHEIMPAHTSRLAFSAEFYDLCVPYEKPAREEATPPAFVLTLAQGRVYADNYDSVAVIAADGRLVGDASFQFAKKVWNLIRPEDNNIFRQRYFLPPVPVAGTVCSLLSGGGAAMGNYSHWLLDSLPRLHLVREAGLWQSIDYFLVYDRHNRFVQETMGLLGVAPERLLDVQTHRHLLADRLVVPSAVRGRGRHFPRWTFDFMRTAYLAAAARVTRQFSPLVYISRRDAAVRRVRNEAEVEALLHPLGFATYALSDLSFAEKVALFAQARVLVSPVGAGLANIGFCAPGTTLVELLPYHFVVADFLEMSARLDMHHYPLVSAGTGDGAGAGADRLGDLTVDVPALAQLLATARAQAPALTEAS
ncbi:glycosyltransferase family 61 protein [Hymenobacter sp. H14-R3]|uniref:glycosyltransferase family 61 protein n=1 Tax=Hymenobacter sp. H14-R3 TaxID=3046308 RepID=UPI0024BAC970|nr:glycosyltransferase family 61 protein [Hymenobacter sp. H14-R3]MDJ0367181.1 glycosyltransferase family 61 protein [Hymenobacter sp. H14-R3]